MKKHKRFAAFTLIEMLVVLLIISILILLFVPNLTKQKESIRNTGRGAVVKVVESQAELYELENESYPSLSSLVSGGYISQEQADNYNEYYAKNADKPRQVN